jgi:hypothetical protein
MTRKNKPNDQSPQPPTQWANPSAGPSEAELEQLADFLSFIMDKALDQMANDETLPDEMRQHAQKERSRGPLKITLAPIPLRRSNLDPNYD